MASIDLHLAQVISQEMAKSGISEARMADLTGIPRTTLHRRLTHGGDITAAEVHSIAIVLGTTGASLFGAAQLRAA